jgi:large subunit ribosomal protein L24
MAKYKLKKGDVVIVVAGKNKGKTGEILKVFPAVNRAIVAGVNMVKKHQKATKTAAAAIIEKETKIHISNIAYVDSKGAATKIAFKILEDGSKVRIAKTTGEVIANK